MIEVVIDKAGATPQRFKLGGGVYGLGRNATNEIVLDDKEVSRHHARLLVDGDMVLIEDLQSGNGTFVEGQPVLDAPLSIGDSVEIMPFTLRIANAEDETEEEPQLCYLDCIEGPLVGERFYLDGDALSAGRSDDQDIALADPSASRSHALFIKRPSGWTVRDNNSANGLAINAQRLREAVLRPGDQVQLGSTILRFVDPSADDEDDDGLDLEDATLEANAFEVVGRQRAEQARARLLDEPEAMSPAAAAAPKSVTAKPAGSVDPIVMAAVVFVGLIGFMVVGLVAMKLMGGAG